VASDSGEWEYPYVWRKPQGRELFSEEDIDKHDGDNDAYVAGMEWASYIFCPACEHLDKDMHLSGPMFALVDWLTDEMRSRQALMALFDAPRIARRLRLPMTTILAARDALVRLRVLWMARYDEDESGDTRIELGVNFRFHKWITDSATIQRVWDEESQKYNHTRSRPQEARAHLMRDPIAPDVRWQIYARDKFTCRYCDVSGVPLALDHVIPVFRGGTNDPDNLITSCQSCNSRKGSQWPEER